MRIVNVVAVTQCDAYSNFPVHARIDIQPFDDSYCGICTSRTGQVRLSESVGCTGVRRVDHRTRRGGCVVRNGADARTHLMIKERK